MATVEQVRKAERKAFHPIAADVDEVAERMAKQKGIPSLVAADRESDESLHGQASDVRPAKSETQVRFTCPGYLADELCRAALETSRWGGDRVTVNYIVLEALKHRGYHINDEDLVKDGRRAKKRR